MMNYLSLADTYGRGLDDKQRAEANALAMDSQRQGNALNQRDMQLREQRFQADQGANSAAAERALIEWGLGSTAQVLANPQLLPQWVEEGKRRGLLEPTATPDQVTLPDLQDLHGKFKVALGQPPEKPQLTDDEREYMRAKDGGYTGSFYDWQTKNKAAGTTVNVNQAPKPPQGYRNVYDDQGNFTGQEPVSGGPVDRADAERRAGEVNQADIVTQEIQRIFTKMKSGVLPDAGALYEIIAKVPGTDAAGIKGLVTTIKANIGFNELNRMRKASPTGGALGGVNKAELDFLQSVAGSLDPSQKEDFVYNLKRLWNGLQDTVHGEGNGPERFQLEQQQQPEVPEDVQALWEFMTPEERALWQQ